VAALAIVATVLAIYVPVTALAPVPAIAAQSTAFTSTPTTAQSYTLPSYGASAISAIGFPGPLAKAGSSKPVPIASITKIVTALVVLQKKPLVLGNAGPDILFTSADQSIENEYAAQDGEVAPIAVGQSMSESAVLSVALIPSANNYARALADWAYGSEPKFLVAANAWLKSHGLDSTHLADSTGLNSNTRSTPTDLIALGQLALANPVIAHIVSTKNTTLPVVGAIKNTNTLLGKYGVTGIKTGTLLGAGSSLLFSSTFEIGGRTITLVGAVLDGPTHPIIDVVIRDLILRAREAFVDLHVVDTGHRFGSYSTRWGTTSTAVGTRSVSVVVLKGTVVVSHVTMKPVRLAKAGSVVGTATFTVGSQTFADPIVLTTSLRDPGFWWRVSHPGKLSSS
jgi:D-alanyl-D-alanine carboxypeptidase (penicillin-binding protein 5/6)